VRRRNGEDVTALFAQFAPVLDGITAVDGTGLVFPNTTGKATWTIVPTTDAVGAVPEEFLVNGVLRYRHEGLQLTVPLAPTVITVHPSPSLAVKYFHQRDVFADDPFTVEVEPSIPYSLAVMVQNKGHGAARNVRIVSAQPQIVENEKGLFADFRIIATEVAGQNLQPSLTVEFGQIDPGTNAIGRWLLSSSILGVFIDYSATFEHLDGLGSKKLSLIEGVEIHELIHIVKALGVFNDGRPDFLVNDVADLYDRPDTLHLSDGSVAPVSMITEASFNHAPATNNLIVQMTAPLPGGWDYLRVPDPGTNRFRLARVLRSDGAEIPFGDNAWTTDRTFLGNARRPLRENMLHVFDLNSPGAYTLFYSNLPAADVTEPQSFVAQLPPDSTARIPVNWSGQDNPGGSGISFFDVYVSIDNAPFILWQKETIDRTAVFQGGFGRTYAFYSVATDIAGNREAIPFTPDAQTTVTRTNRAPILDAIPNQVVQEGEILFVQAIASDPDGDELIFSLGPNPPPGVVIHPYTGLLSWVTGEGNGPSLNTVTVQVLDNGSPRLGAVRAFQITIADENSAPALAPIANRTINEGRLLSITNSALDFDLPHQTLTFSLAPGAPAGATVDSASGVFQWRPAEFQGGTTNAFAILVADNGSPAMTATQRFSVIVRDTQTDFTVGIGTTNVLAGSSNAVPIQLASSADLDHITFELTATDAHLAALNLRSLAAELTSASFEPIAQGLYRLRMDFDPANLQTGSRALAWLNFDTQLTGHSSIAHLNLDALTAARTTGEPLDNGTAIRGRIFIIENEPLLDTVLAVPGMLRLTLYGLPGEQYQLQSAPALGPNAIWGNEILVTLPTTYQTLDRPVADEPARLFRVREQ
ncbi:MAG TPA: putative Ig domain-containing protein, partial [Bryobacteraceae bacterium]|nr:putative Ig domain-containing protein [Bryobacteraceae bacterium]